MKPIKTVGMSLMSAMLLGVPLAALPTNAMAEVSVVQQNGVVKGIVKSTTGEPLMGAVVFVVGTKTNALTDDSGAFTLKGVKNGATIRVSLIGYNKKEVKWNGGDLDIALEEMGTGLNEVVVTAMGIVRKEKSLTYATQQIKADDFMKVQDPNLVNSIEGKVSGVTITPSAGGAGGSSKIQLRGASSITGDNAPLIVVDGIPMSNERRGSQVSAAQMFEESGGEGGDPLSQINPDDIESMNILKGANAAALYGSKAANGVIMITTKKGKEGRMSVNFTSNVTFDKALLTPELQNNYGVQIDATGSMSPSSWGRPMGEYQNLLVDVDASGANLTPYQAHLRAGAQDDVKDFYRTGVTTNNSISLSGGTDKIRTYVSYANAHANGMLRNNSYNRNTIAFRQSYKFFDRVNIDVNANYVQTVTKNRVGGGLLWNPIYDLYTAPRNVDMDYYRHSWQRDNAKWKDTNGMYGVYKDPESGELTEGKVYHTLQGSGQDYYYQGPKVNNPYWDMNARKMVNKESRFYGSVQGKVDIWDGLAFQARMSFDYANVNDESTRRASTWSTVAMEPYGAYWWAADRKSDIYTDYLLMYNKTFKEDWSVSATAGWVGHKSKVRTTSIDVKNAAVLHNGDILLPEGTDIIYNVFYPNVARGGASKNVSSNWDKAALVTAQLGWKDAVYVDGSYRRDWYRPFKQFSFQGTPDNYGYFGFGANAILSSLIHMPKWISYAKYRLSYSEVGNSIPSVLFASRGVDLATGSSQPYQYAPFTPVPEKTKSFETGIETQFFDNSLNFDFTYYNTSMHNSYMIVNTGGLLPQPMNSGVIRNQGFEMTLGYNFNFGHDWRWKTSLNMSYNKSKVEKTYKNAEGVSQPYTVNVGQIQVRYNEGDEYGVMYGTDVNRWGQDVLDAEGNLLYAKGDVYLGQGGVPAYDGVTVTLDENGKEVMSAANPYALKLGNMNSKVQLGWSNTISWKDFTLFFMINGRIGGKVISNTERMLDSFGTSKRTGDARDNAIRRDGDDYFMYLYGGGQPQEVNVEDYYKAVSKDGYSSYVYDATNFRLRELSLGYTFRNLFGENRNLSLSFIGRNLFFIYKDAPVDPDLSLSSNNSLGAVESFNLPSSRSFGINLKLNF